MLRRSHKKSRGGCLQCKRRHVKCDEGRPVCRLCLNSERACSFASQAAVPPAISNLSAVSKPARLQSATLDPSHPRNGGRSDAITLPNVTHLAFTSLMGHDVAESPAGVGNRGDFAFDDTLNLEHLELLIHLIHDHDIAALADQTGPWFSRISIALQTSLKWPFLLYELLAFSARHLAFLRPERSAAFLHQAITLQTRAVSLFNSTASWATTGVIDQSNCVAVLLFSSILGHHLLADTLARRDPGGLDAFMDHYVQCVKAHRGVLAVASGAWPLLMESQLEPALSLSSGFTSRPPRGSHCQPIFELVEGAHGLADADKEACRLAVQYMQVGFDAVLADEGQEKGTRYQMIMLWTVMAPPEFTSLLAAKRPEVLIILSYYAALLHYGKHLWQVGDAGAYILGIIVDYLGQEWDHWLEFPRSIINIDLE